MISQLLKTVLYIMIIEKNHIHSGLKKKKVKLIGNINISKIAFQGTQQL